MEKRILIVEDNENLRSILALILSACGYKTLVAETGAAAIESAMSLKPDLILMDLDLPDMAGSEVARKIMKNPQSSRIPIIGCSAFSAWLEAEEARNAGMVDYLQKPIAAHVLKKKIEKYCG